MVKQTETEAVSGPDELEEFYYRPNEVALMFRVDPKTVTRWADEGRITSVRTPGGHRRYPKTEVDALLRHRDTAGM